MHAYIDDVYLLKEINPFSNINLLREASAFPFERMNPANANVSNSLIICPASFTYLQLIMQIRTFGMFS